MKSHLDRLAKDLENEEEPELLKAVNYAFIEYSCMLRFLRVEVLTFLSMYLNARLRRIANTAKTVIL